MLVLAGTLLVTEVVPDLLTEDPPEQEVIPSAQLSPARTPQPAVAPVRSITVVEAALPEPATGGPGGGGGGQVPAPVGQPDPGGPVPGGPAGPGGPGTGPEPQPDPEGPVGSTLDPVVQGVVDTADGATGGATAPVTGPVTDLVDGVTDTVDGLLALQ